MVLAEHRCSQMSERNLYPGDWKDKRGCRLGTETRRMFDFPHGIKFH